MAEVVVGELARRIGLATPRLVGLDLDPQIARYEADEEVQDLLGASAGLNLGIDFLPGAFGYDGTVHDGSDVAAKVLWLDAFTANVDRSWRNPNLLVWHGRLWVIDHGAALYFHHGWSGGVTDPERFARQPWDVDDHVLGAHVGGLTRADEEITGLLDQQVFAEVLADVPDQWLEPVPGADTPDAVRGGLRLVPGRAAVDPAVASRGGGGMSTPFKCSLRSARPPHKATRCARASAGTPANGDPA